MSVLMSQPSLLLLGNIRCVVGPLELGWHALVLLNFAETFPPKEWFFQCFRRLGLYKDVLTQVKPVVLDKKA